jgi:hypothetical protein
MALLTERYTEAEQKHYDIGYKYGIESAGPQAAELELENMMDATGGHYYSVTRISPYTARRLGRPVTGGDVREYEEELDRICEEWAFWEGVRSALSDRR